MKVILLETIKTLGNKGDIKDVAEGYARNFLMPKKMAEAATEQSIKENESMHEELKKKKEEDQDKLKKIASGLQGKKIIIKAKAEKEKLFGSIGAKEISQALKKANFEISEESIILIEPIKKIGETEVVVKLKKNIKTKITVAVEKA